MEGLKLERILEGKRLKNNKIIYVYPLFLSYRICFTMIPTIFYNKPGV